MSGLRLNARLFLLILHNVDAEMGKVEPLAFSNEDGKARFQTQLSVHAQKLLVWLRQLSAWFTYRAPWFAQEMDDHDLNQISSQMLTAYRSVIRHLASIFHLADLPKISHLLEEDEATLGFAPFQDISNQRLRERYFNEGEPKSKAYTHATKDCNDMYESLGRVRDILEDCLIIEKHKVRNSET